MNTLKLSVRSSLNHFRLQVTATGVDEAEHWRCSVGGYEDEAEAALTQVGRKLWMKITTSSGTFTELPQTPNFFCLVNCSVSRRSTAALFFTNLVQIARQSVDEPVPSEPT